MTIREMMAMYHSLKFVEELIDYIAEYYDDDYMTMECLCRKLHKYGLVDKKDGFYLVADGTTADRKTEPSEHRDCINCEDASDCAKCRGIEDEPQTEYIRVGQAIDSVTGKVLGETYDVPQTDCSWQ